MNASNRARLAWCLAAAVVVLAVAVPASAATFSLSLSAPRSAAVGKPLVIRASGTDPTDQGALYLEIDAIPASVTTNCPSGYLDGAQLATSTGGSLVAFDQRENLDSSGHFSTQVGYTPKAVGGVLLCGYTDDGATDTLATASALVQVTKASAHAGRPVNTKKPRVTRAGHRLSCKRGRWSHAPKRYSYRWLVGAKTKRGAHGRTLAVTRGLRRRTVRCRVTASNAAGHSSATSPPYHVR